MNPDSTAAVDHLRETLVARRAVYEGRLLRVFEDTVALPGGREARREIVQHRGAVAIVAVASDGRVVLVRQWRHAVEGAIWEIPAGTRETDEEPRSTALRELAEETGYHARSWSSMGVACVSPGYSREMISFFLARELTPGDAAADADELLDVRLAGPDEIHGLVRRGEIDCKTLAGLALAGLLPPIAAGEMPG